MGFNFGAFAGGMANGIESGVQVSDQMQQRALREAQLKALTSGQLGEQAYVQSLMPGGTPMPQGANQQGIVPMLSKLPVVGAIGRELGLWGEMPQVNQAPQPYGQTSPGPQPGQGGGQQAMSGQPQPQASSAPTSQAPQPQAPAGQPSGQGFSPQEIATAIDKANPGLRVSNPAAFAQAVQIGISRAAEMQKSQLNTDLTRSQIAGNQADTAYKAGPAVDLARAQTDNTKAMTEVHQGEARLAPAKLKLQEAQQKLEEAKADQAQAKMRLDEAESNAKLGDYASQREWRDAQIANMRAERLRKTAEDKIKELKTGAEVKELEARTDLNEAHGRLYDSQAGGAGVSRAKDKEVNVALGKAQMMLRHYENQDRQLLQSINPNDPRIKALRTEIAPLIQENRARVKELEAQLSTAKKAPEAAAPSAPQEVPAPRQQDLAKVSAKLLEFANSNDTASAQKLIDLMKAKGIPPHEIQWAMEHARTLSNGAPAARPQVPQSR